MVSWYNIRTQYLHDFACRQVHHLYHSFTIAYLHQRVKSYIFSNVPLTKIKLTAVIISFESENETSIFSKGYNKEIVVDWLKQTSVQFRAGRIWNFPYRLALGHTPQSRSAVQRAGQDCVIIY